MNKIDIIIHSLGASDWAFWAHMCAWSTNAEAYCHTSDTGRETNIALSVGFVLIVKTDIRQLKHVISM